jgi:hypothetical protein
MRTGFRMEERTHCDCRLVEIEKTVAGAGWFQGERRRRERSNRALSTLTPDL